MPENYNLRSNKCSTQVARFHLSGQTTAQSQRT